MSAEDDLAATACRFAPRISFAHLRSTRRYQYGVSFIEAEHLDRDFDMVAVPDALLCEDPRRLEADWIVFWPDYGHRTVETKRMAASDSRPGSAIRVSPYLDTMMVRGASAAVHHECR